MCDDLTMMFVFFFLALDIIEYEYNTSATNFVLNLNIIQLSTTSCRLQMFQSNFKCTTQVLSLKCFPIITKTHFTWNAINIYNFAKCVLTKKQISFVLDIHHFEVVINMNNIKLWYQCVKSIGFKNNSFSLVIVKRKHNFFKSTALVNLSPSHNLGWKQSPFAEINKEDTGFVFVYKLLCLISCFP